MNQYQRPIQQLLIIDYMIPIAQKVLVELRYSPIRENINHSSKNPAIRGSWLLVEGPMLLERHLEFTKYRRLHFT